MKSQLAQRPRESGRALGRTPTHPATPSKLWGFLAVSATLMGPVAAQASVFGFTGYYATGSSAYIADQSGCPVSGAEGNWNAQCSSSGSASKSYNAAVDYIAADPSVSQAETLEITGPSRLPTLNTATFFDYGIVALTSGLWTFDWSYSGNDARNLDTAGYFIKTGNIVSRNQFANNTQDPANGHSSTLFVNAGDVFGWYVYSSNTNLLPGILDITNLVAPDATTLPEPTTLALLAWGAAGTLVARRRRSNPCGKSGT